MKSFRRHRISTPRHVDVYDCTTRYNIRQPDTTAALSCFTVIVLSVRENTVTMPDLPSPPFVPVEGIANFRDIGGYPATSGQHVQNGLVYRCADPSKATESGLQKMSKDLGKVCLLAKPFLIPPHDR